MVFGCVSNINCEAGGSAGTHYVELKGSNIPLSNDNNCANGIGCSSQLQHSFQSNSIIYSWNNISAHISNKNGPSKQILSDVNGIAYPGELFLIAGSSGCGKTTLLNALTFQNYDDKLNIIGERFINGRPAFGRNNLAAVSSYCVQIDNFIGILTVKEHLVFQALLRMDATISYQHKMELVDEIIQKVGLSECENTKIGIPDKVKGISGGEMKRLSFATELLTDSPLLFCDEPTSGLDSVLAESVMKFLQKLALEEGKTIICTVHQPSSQVYAMFDRILLMSEGKVIFLGESDQILPFFQENGYSCPPNYNPADFFMQIISKPYGDLADQNSEEIFRTNIRKLAENFSQSSIAADMKKQISSPTLKMKIRDNGEAHNLHGMKSSYNEEGQLDQVSNIVFHDINPCGQTYRASWCIQFRLICWRSWLKIIRDPDLLRIRISQQIIFAIFIGFVYFGQTYNQDGVQNINGALFTLITQITYQTLFAATDVFCTEWEIFRRESHFNKMYRIDAYFLGRTMADFPLSLIYTCLTIAIAYFMMFGFKNFLSFVVMLGIYLLVGQCARSLGYLLSCLVSDISQVLSIAPTILTPLLLCGGFFMNSGSIPVYLIWVKYISWFNYGFQALMIEQWQSVDHIECNRYNSTCPKNGQDVLATLNIDSNNFEFTILAMIVIILVLQFFAYLTLWYKCSEKNKS